jgi:hypothetical protein
MITHISMILAKYYKIYVTSEDYSDLVDDWHEEVLKEFWKVYVNRGQESENVFYGEKDKSHKPEKNFDQKKKVWVRSTKAADDLMRGESKQGVQRWKWQWQHKRKHHLLQVPEEKGALRSWYPLKAEETRSFVAASEQEEEAPISNIWLECNLVCPSKTTV